MPWEQYFSYDLHCGDSFWHLTSNAYDFFEIPKWIAVNYWNTACMHLTVCQPSIWIFHIKLKRPSLGCRFNQWLLCRLSTDGCRLCRVDSADSVDSTQRRRSRSLITRLCQTVRNWTNRKVFQPIEWGENLKQQCVVMKLAIHGC